jgi:transposase-like protein
MGKRRYFLPQFKAERVLELLNGTHTPTEACQTNGIKLSLLLAWRKRRVEQAPKLFDRESDRDPAHGQIAELERLVGASDLGVRRGKKSLQSLADSPDRKREVIMALAQDYPLALVARVVGCPCSTLYAPARP